MIDCLHLTRFAVYILYYLVRSTVVKKPLEGGDEELQLDKFTYLVEGEELVDPKLNVPGSVLRDYILPAGRFVCEGRVGQIDQCVNSVSRSESVLRLEIGRLHTSLTTTAVPIMLITTTPTMPVKRLQQHKPTYLLSTPVRFRVWINSFATTVLAQVCCCCPQVYF